MICPSSYHLDYILYCTNRVMQCCRYQRINTSFKDHFETTHAQAKQRVKAKSRNSTLYLARLPLDYTK